MTAPANLVAVGIAPEPTYGTLTAPTMILPWSTLTPVDSNKVLVDKSWRASAASVVGHETGVQAAQLQLAGPVLPDSIGHLLVGVLGDTQFASGSPNTWTLALLNSGTQQPTSHTVSLFDAVGQLQWAGCKVSQLQFDYDAGALLKWTATLAGLASTVPGSMSMPAQSSEIVMPSWAAACQVGGSAEVRLLTAQVTLARQVTAKYNATGAQTPWLQRSDVLGVTGKLAVAVATDSYRSLFLAGSVSSLDLNYQTGSGAGLRQLELHCSNVVLTQSARTYGSKWVEVEASFEAAANATDAGASGGLSPVKATLRNNVTSGGY